MIFQGINRSAVNRRLLSAILVVGGIGGIGAIGGQVDGAAESHRVQHATALHDEAESSRPDPESYSNVVRGPLPKFMRERMLTDVWRTNFSPRQMREETRDFLREMSAVRGEAARREAAIALSIRADLLQPEDLGEANTLRMRAAFAFRDLGVEFLRRELLKVVETAPSHWRSVDALRLLGTQEMLQAGFMQGPDSYEDAVRTFSQLRDHFESGDLDLQIGSHRHYVNGMFHLANLKKIRGRDDRAIEIRDVLLRHEWLPLSEEKALIALLDNARAAMRLDDDPRAAMYYDLLFEHFPEHGYDDGRIVDLKVERVLAEGHPRLSPQSADRFEEIYRDPRFESFVPQRVRLGTNIAVARAGDPARSAEMFEEVSALVANLYARQGHLELTAEQQEQIRVLYGNALANLVQLYELHLRDQPGRQRAVEELKQEFPDDSPLQIH